MYNVYILQSLSNGGFYIGVANNLKRRINENNSGQSKSTRFRIPFKLVRFEEYECIKTAYKRERFLKKLKSRKLIVKIIKSPNVRL